MEDCSSALACGSMHPFMHPAVSSPLAALVSLERMTENSRVVQSLTPVRMHACVRIAAVRSQVSINALSNFEITVTVSVSALPD